MRRETQNLLLVLLGGALLKLAVTGTHVRYVKPSFLPWLVAAGAVMIVLAVCAIVRDVRSAGGADAAGHEHGSRSPWMLLLPVFAVFLVAPPALGSDSVERAGELAAVPQRPGGDAVFGDLPPGPAPLLPVSEFVTRAVWDGSGALAERPIRLRGFVVPAEEPGQPVRLARMRINCCAADASPVRVDLVGKAAGRFAALPADTWIEVTGTLRPGTATEADGQVPAFEVSRGRTIPVPARPYEY